MILCYIFTKVVYRLVFGVRCTIVRVIGVLVCVFTIWQSSMVLSSYVKDVFTMLHDVVQLWRTRT